MLNSYSVGKSVLESEAGCQSSRTSDMHNTQKGRLLFSCAYAHNMAYDRNLNLKPLEIAWKHYFNFQT